MSERSGRRQLLSKLLGRTEEEPSPKSPPASGLAPMSEDDVRARLAALSVAEPPTARAPSYLGELLGHGSAAPADARGPGSQRGRALPVLPIVRPPGAVPEARFAELCDACGACADACPHGAIFGLDARHGAVRGTPTISGARSPCLMCEGFPCIAACDRGALVPDAPTRIAVASIRQFDCLAYGGGFCSTCAERCPTPGAIAREDGKPRVVESECTGCGVCQHVCPAPRNAVLLVARPARMEGA